MKGADSLNFVEEVAISLVSVGHLSTQYVNAERSPFTSTHTPDILINSGEKKFFLELSFPVHKLKPQSVSAEFAADRIEFAQDYLGVKLDRYVLIILDQNNNEAMPWNGAPNFVVLKTDCTIAATLGLLILPYLVFEN
jgi:hypothetical protein